MTTKRKRPPIDEEETTKKASKRIKVTEHPQGKSLRGFQWDADNWSCAYDSLLTILLSLYQECSDSWQLELGGQSEILRQIGTLFQNNLNLIPTMTLHEVRDSIRDSLGANVPEIAAKGREMTDIYTVVRHMLKVDDNMVDRQYQCRACEYQSEVQKINQTVWICDAQFWKNNPAKLGTHKGKTIMQ